MKTEENLATVRVVRPDKIMFETGASGVMTLSALFLIVNFMFRFSVVFHDYHTRLKSTPPKTSSFATLSVFPTVSKVGSLRLWEASEG